MFKRNTYISFFAVVYFVCIAVFGGSTFAIGGIGGHPLKPLDKEHKGWFMYQLKPGESFDDVLVVKNTTNKAWLVDIYAADSVPSSGGGFALKQKVEEMTELGSWLKLSTNEVLLEAGQSKQVPFTLTIPVGTEIGEWSGGIMMEKMDPAEKEVVRENMGSGIRLSVRTGVRVYNLIPGDIRNELFIEEGQGVLREKRNKDKVFVVTVPVRNTGNISTYAKFITKARDLYSGEVIFDNADEPSSYLVSPNTVFDYNQEILVPKLPKINVSLADLEVETQVYMVVGEEEVLLGEISYAERIIPIKEITYLIAAIAGLILLTTTLVILRIRKYSGKGWGSYTVKTGDTIVSLATEHGVDWEFLAKVNKLRSPYIISKGDKILVPPKPKKK